MTLYEIEERYLNLAALLSDPTIEEREILDAMETIKEDLLEPKVLAYARIIKNLSADAEAIASEMKRLADRKRALDANVARLKVTAKDAMELACTTKIKDGLFTVSVQKNPPSLDVVDDAIIPDEYRIPQPPVLDKRSMLDQLKAGVAIAGVQIHQGSSLRIR